MLAKYPSSHIIIGSCKICCQGTAINQMTTLQPQLSVFPVSWMLDVVQVIMFLLITSTVLLLHKDSINIHFKAAQRQHLQNEIFISQRFALCYNNALPFYFCPFISA